MARIKNKEPESDIVVDVRDEDAPDAAPLRFNRAAHNRANTRRMNNERPPLDFSIGSRFNIPKEITEADPDNIYGFIPYMAGGEQLQDIVDDAVERGWWPVLKSEHPILARRYLSDVFGKTEQCDYIKKGGQIAMKRSRIDHDHEMDQYKQMDKRNEELRKTMVLFDKSNHGPLRNF